MDDVLAVLVAGLIGYALGGWLGVAVGAGSATAVSVLLEPLTPPGDRQTAHERRMRRNRRYRTRYEALEEGWRHPYRPKQRTDWKPVNRLVAEGRAAEPVLPIEIVPLPAAIADSEPAPALEAPKPAANAEPAPAVEAPKRAAIAEAAPALEPPKPAAKPAAKRKRAEPKPAAARKPRAPRATRTAAAKPT